MAHWSRFLNIIITGGSSGIGRALAEEYAQTGAHLLLTGTNKERLEAAKEACLEKGAKSVEIAQVDVCDKENMRQCILAFNKEKPIDLVVANAGISGRTSKEESIEDQTKKIYAVNVTGVFNTCFPALECMEQKNNGKIAVVASAAGLATFPYAIAYSSSKIAVRAWTEGMYERYRTKNIEFCSICPGFISTPMTKDTPFSTPTKLPVEKAVKIMFTGIEGFKPRLVFPYTFKIGLYLLNLLPLRLSLFLAAFAHGRKKSNRV